MTQEPKITRKELDLRFSRIRDYNKYQIEAGQPHHCTKHHELEHALKQWGYPIKMAVEVLGPRPKAWRGKDQPEPPKPLAIANVAPTAASNQGIENDL